MKSEELAEAQERMKARMKRRAPSSASVSPQFDLVSHLEKAAAQKRFVAQTGQLVRGRDGWLARFYVTDPLAKNAEGNWGPKKLSRTGECSTFPYSDDVSTGAFSGEFLSEWIKSQNPI